MTENEASCTLEGIIDREGLPRVLSLLAEICWEKANHLRANWQDDSAARQWAKAGHKVDACGVAVARLL